MIDNLARWLEAQLRAQGQQGRRGDDTLRLASAALLVEAARADHHFDAREREQLLALLRSRHALAADEADLLLTHARARAANAVSLTELTQVVKTHTDAAQRKQLLVAMWQVALADGQVDKYEEYIIRQVASLLYVPHLDYIHARELARAGDDGNPGEPGRAG